MSDFYKVFEDHFYANEQKILELRSFYLPFIYPLLESFEGSMVFDFGCGRGEWLELMRKFGFDVHGVDLDEGMLESATAKSLNVFRSDGIEYIRNLPSNSHAVVTAFHVIEHIPHESLNIFLAEALRILKPGGLLIMETPNPENIIVSTKNFYLDPTHIRQIPAEYLKFLANYLGFEKSEIMFLNESTVKDSGLYGVLSGVSPDYAVIARKSGPSNISNPIDRLLSGRSGLSLMGVASDYDNLLVNQIQDIKSQLLHIQNTVFDHELSLDKRINIFKVAIKVTIRRLFWLIQKSPKLSRIVKKIAVLILKPFPKIKQKLMQLIGIHPLSHSKFEEIFFGSEKNMSLVTRSIYKTLKDASYK